MRKTGVKNNEGTGVTFGPLPELALPDKVQRTQVI